MGKVKLYTPFDILLELLRTQLYEYRNCVLNNRKMQKVNKRIERIDFILSILSEKEKNQINGEILDCYNEFERLKEEMRQISIETPNIQITEKIQHLLRDFSIVSKFSNIYDFLNCNLQVSPSNIHKLLKEQMNPLVLEKFINVFEVNGEIYIKQAQYLKKNKTGYQEGVNYKRDVQSDFLKNLPIVTRLKIYTFCLDLIDKMSKCIQEDVVFAGGTGQIVALLYNKIQGAEKNFSFGDIDSKVKLNSDTNIKSLQLQLNSFFINLINQQEDNDIFHITLEDDNYLFETHPTVYHRAMKIGNEKITTLYRLKHNNNPLLFDLIDLFIEKEERISIIFRLFLQIKITSKQNPVYQKIIQLELLDVSIHLRQFLIHAETNAQIKQKKCGEMFAVKQQHIDIDIITIKNIINANLSSSLKQT